MIKINEINITHAMTIGSANITHSTNFYSAKPSSLIRLKTGLTTAQIITETIGGYGRRMVINGVRVDVWVISNDSSNYIMLVNTKRGMSIEVPLSYDEERISNINKMVDELIEMMAVKSAQIIKENDNAR